MAARKPRQPARAPDDREREAQSQPARVLDGDTVAVLLRDHEASGHLLDYHHTRNGACMMQAALVYLEAGAPLPPLIREWMAGAFQRALAGGDSVTLASALELLPDKRTGRRKSQSTRDTTRRMVEAITLEIDRKRHLMARQRGGARLPRDAAALAKESDRSIATRVGKRFGRSAAWRTYCAWQSVNGSPGER